MARSMLSLGMDCDLASFTARRRRGFLSGSGSPILAATVISLDSFENSFERSLSCRPLRCWMFAHFEWPAMKNLIIRAEICVSIGHPAGHPQPRLKRPDKGDHEGDDRREREVQRNTELEKISKSVTAGAI